MADGHRGVLVKQEDGHRFADDVRASHHDRPSAPDLDLLSQQHFHDPGGRARHEPRPALLQETDVFGVEAVDVFCRIDAAENGRGVDPVGQRQLDENAIDLGVPVEPVDELLELRLIGRLGQLVGP